MCDVAVHLEMFATTHPASWRKEQLELFPVANWRPTSLFLSVGVYFRCFGLPHLDTISCFQHDHAFVNPFHVQRLSIISLAFQVNIRGHSGRVVTLSPPTSESGFGSRHGLKWESW